MQTVRVHELLVLPCALQVWGFRVRRRGEYLGAQGGGGPGEQQG